VKVAPTRFNRVVLDIFTLGLYELWYRRTVYEVNGEVLIERGIFRRNETHIPGNRINAVKAKLRPLIGTSSVAIDTGAAETAEATKLSRRDARAFATACRALKERST
jgi:uncharacterized membrane protein YdbT with pleckstrin-like domain